MSKDVKRKIRITGRKKRCQHCTHVHKQPGKGKSWDCMKKGCKCSGMTVAGIRLRDGMKLSDL